LAEIML